MVEVVDVVVVVVVVVLVVVVVSMQGVYQRWHAAPVPGSVGDPQGQ